MIGQHGACLAELAAERKRADSAEHAYSQMCFRCDVAEGNLARLAADMHKDADERTSTESAVCYCSTPPHSGEDHYKEGMTT